MRLLQITLRAGEHNADPGSRFSLPLSCVCGTSCIPSSPQLFAPWSHLTVARKKRGNQGVRSIYPTQKGRTASATFLIIQRNLAYGLLCDWSTIFTSPKTVAMKVIWSSITRGLYSLSGRLLRQLVISNTNFPPVSSVPRPLTIGQAVAFRFILRDAPG